VCGPCVSKKNKKRCTLFGIFQEPHIPHESRLAECMCVRYESIFMCWDGVWGAGVVPMLTLWKRGSKWSHQRREGEMQQTVFPSFFFFLLPSLYGMPPKDIDWTLQTRDCILNTSGSQVEGARHGRGVWMDVGGL
jgi:hypothetical protein